MPQSIMVGILSAPSSGGVTSAGVTVDGIGVRAQLDFLVKKASSYILGTVQSTLHFNSLTDLFTQTPSRLLRGASSHMLQLMREGCSYTYPPLSIASYSFIQE